MVEAHGERPSFDEASGLPPFPDDGGHFGESHSSGPAVILLPSLAAIHRQASQQEPNPRRLSSQLIEYTADYLKLSLN